MNCSFIPETDLYLRKRVMYIAWIGSHHAISKLSHFYFITARLTVKEKWIVFAHFIFYVKLEKNGFGIGENNINVNTTSEPQPRRFKDCTGFYAQVISTSPLRRECSCLRCNRERKTEEGYGRVMKVLSFCLPKHRKRKPGIEDLARGEKVGGGDAKLCR